MLKPMEAQMKKLVSKLWIFVVSILIISYGTLGVAEQDLILLNGTIEAAKSLVFPNYDVQITYDKNTSVVYVKFRTPASYKVNYSNFYERWSDNQWVVLQEFKRAEIPVSKVTVETNHNDMSGLLKMTTSAKHIDKYAKRASDDLWLRTSVSYQKAKGSKVWKKLDY